MIESYENIIRKVIFRKYPVLSDVVIEDEYEGFGNVRWFVGESYKVLYKTDECLDEELQKQIDKETKLLIKYFPNQDNPFSQGADVKCYFDCGEGYEFRGSLNYKH